MICTDCVLHQYALTNCVPGRGPEQARIMVVGQAPGVKEDTLGECFIGKSGVLLDEMLRDAGFDPDAIYRTNAVKCKPPVEKGTFSERAPVTEEIDACRRHLTEEIHRIKPEVIIALGDTALRSLTRQSGISNKRGKAQPLHKSFAYACDVYPTYHPAFVARKPVARPTVVTDLQRVRDRGVEQSRIKWARHVSHTIFADYAAIDLELIDTAGKIVAYPTQLAVATNDADAKVFDARFEFLACIVFDIQAPLVHHNGLEFDLPKLSLPPKGYDTMYLGHLDDETQPLGLEALCVKYLGVRGWKEDEYAPLGSDELAEYNARDAVFTLRLFHVLRERLGPRIKIYEKILLPARRSLNACSARGLWIDGVNVEQVRGVVEESIERDRQRVIAIASEYADTSKFNPNSVDQVAAILTTMGYALPRTRDTGKLSVTKGVLQAIEHPFATALLALRSSVKRRSTYVRPYAKAAASPSHRMHNEYTLIRTAVGRTSARKSNVQNLDRELAFFSAPPGGVYVKCDYSALHFRLAAWCAGAHSILDRYAENRLWDPHKYFASIFYGIPEEQVTKAQRQIAKSANFSQLYLGDAGTLQNYAYKNGLDLPLEFCERVHTGWHHTFPEFVPWYERVWEEVVANEYAQTPVGRRRNFGDVRLLNKSGRAAVLREAVNFKVLGLEPDLALTGLNLCHAEGLPVNGFFHDAVSFEFDNLHDFEHNKETITDCMTTRALAFLRNEFGTDITVPIDVEFTLYKGA